MPALQDLVTLLLLCAMWVSFLWFRYLRSARTIAYLVLATAIYVGAGVTPDPWPLLLRISVAASVAALQFRFNHLLSALPQDVLSFWDAYVAVNKRMTTAYSEFERTGDRGPLEAALVKGLADLRALEPPPGERWPRLQEMAADVVSERLQMLRDGSDRQLSAAIRFRTHRADVHRQLQLALDESMRFWR